MKKPDLFAYLDYRKYLKDWYEHRKSVFKGFSYRYFSQKVGSPSPSWLLYIIQGKRNLSSKAIEQFLKGLTLLPKEAAYFRTLVQFNQADITATKDQHYAELLKYSSHSSFKMVEREQYEFYSHWYNHAIRELISVPGFKEDSRWIAKTLQPNITPAQARKALTLLKKLSMVRYNNDGLLKLNDQIITTGNEVRSNAIRAFHRQMIDLAGQSIDTIKPENREISSITASCSATCFTKLKARITEMQDELLHMIENDKDQSDTVVQLNFQLFPLSTQDKTK